MGLVEKRGLKAFQDEHYQKLVDGINSLAGYPIEFEVHWETLAIPDQAQFYNDGWTKVYFTPISGALKGIVADDLGKDGLKQVLKKVILKNEGGYYTGSSAYSLKDGILTIDHQSTTNMDSIKERTDTLERLLMSQM
jgi:hypothetical protein